MDRSAKYGLVQRLRELPGNYRQRKQEIIRFQEKIYQILVCDKDISLLTEICGRGVKSRLNGKILKFSTSENRQGFEGIKIIKSIKSEQEYERIRKLRNSRRVQIIEEFIQELKKYDVHNAMQLLYLSRRKLRPQFSRVTTILGRTLAYDMKQQDILELMNYLGRDLKNEIKEVLREKANIANATDILDYGQNNFVEKFGLTFVNAVIGYKSRAKQEDLMIFADKLGRSLKEELKIILKNINIYGKQELIKTDNRKLLPYKKYFGILANKSFNTMNIDEKRMMAELLF